MSTYIPDEYSNRRKRMFLMKIISKKKIRALNIIIFNLNCHRIILKYNTNYMHTCTPLITSYFVSYVTLLY